MGAASKGSHPMMCLDTTFIIDFLRNVPTAVDAAQDFENEHLMTTEINVYKILVGLYRYENKERMQSEKLKLQELLDRLTVFTLDRVAVDKSARISAELSVKGEGIEPPDVLIAGIMLANGCTNIITRNTDHFKRIRGINVKSY